MSPSRPTPLARAFQACRAPALAILLVSAFGNLAMLAIPLYSIQLNDRVIGSRSESTLVMLSLITLLFLLLYAGLDYVRAGLQLKAGLAFEERLRRALFDRLLRAQRAGLGAVPTQILADVDTVRSGLAAGVVGALCDVPWVPVFGGLLFVLHPLLGAVALVSAGALLVLAVLTELVTKSGVGRSAQFAAQAAAQAAAAFRQGDAVRGLGMADAMRERWADMQAAAIATASAANERSARLLAATKFVRMLAQGGMMAAGAWLAIRQEISPGMMMASSILIGRALAPVEQVVGQWSRLLRLRGALLRLRGLFRDLPEMAEPTQLPAPCGLLELDGVAVAPPGSERPVVHGVSCRIEPGQVVAIVGSSGSGKSSLARAIANVWPTARGTVRIDGADYRHWPEAQLGRHLGYLPQTVELFAGTVRENIARLGQADDAAVIAAATAAGAHELILRLPAGYDTQIGEGGAALSGGMRQRVGLARALFGDPCLLVLDEPNAHLDEEGERALADALTAARAARRAVVIVSHRPHVLAHVDQMLVMSLGRMLAFGPRDQVLSRLRGQRLAVAAANDAPQPQAGAPA